MAEMLGPGYDVEPITSGEAKGIAIVTAVVLGASIGTAIGINFGGIGALPGALIGAGIGLAISAGPMLAKKLWAYFSSPKKIDDNNNTTDANKSKELILSRQSSREELLPAHSNKLSPTTQDKSETITQTINSSSKNQTKV